MAARVPYSGANEAGAGSGRDARPTMATLLLLCSLLLAALGVTAAAFALHGYVGDHLGDRGGGAPQLEHTSAATLLMRPRARFVLLDPPAHARRSPTPASVPEPTGAKSKAKASEKAAGADAHRTPKATSDPPWPWNLFR